MADLGGLVRGQLEGGVSYPTTPAGTVNVYRDTREMAGELGVTQRSVQRYRAEERHPSPERLGRMRQLARARVAERRLAPFRARGAHVHFAGRVLVYTDSRGRPSYRQVRFDRDVSPAQLARGLDAAERAMRSGTGWGDAGDAIIRAAFDSYGSPLEEVSTIDAFSIRPL